MLPEMGDDQTTPLSLLEGIRCQDEAAWQRMVDIFAPMIFNYCRRRGLTPEDCEDVSQAVLVRVYRGIGQFERDQPNRRLRFWMATIIHNEFINLIRSRQNMPIANGGSDHHQRLQQLSESLTESLDDEWCQPVDIVGRALQLIQRDVQANVWEAFVAVQFENLSAKEAAERLGMSEAAVRQAAFRIRQRLKNELAGFF